MAFSPAEEERLRALLQQDASLITLAQNEPAIIQELGAQDITIQDLQLASSLLPTDKIIGRFGGEDKTALLSNLAEFVKSILKLNRVDYGAPLIGSLIYWPLAQMPQEIWSDMNMEFIPYMQQAFDPVKYPLLKMIHPSGVLPADMRAMIVKGFDAGRGVDAGRAIMSFQPGSLIYGDNDFTGSTALLGGLEQGNRAASGYGTPSPSNYPNAKAATSALSITGSVSTYFNATGVAQVDSVAWNTITRAK